MARRLPRPTAATLIALAALFVALGGTSVALTSSGIPDHNGVFHACVNERTGAVRLVNKGTRCRPRATRRAAAEKSVEWSQTGPAGPTGPSDGYYSIPAARGAGGFEASVNVPPGNYIAHGGCTASQTRTASQSSTVPAFGEAQAILTTDPSEVALGVPPPGTVDADAAVPNMGVHLNIPPSPQEYGSASLSNSSAFRLPSGGTISEACGGYFAAHGTAASDQPVQISNTYVTAIRVGSLH